MSIIAQDRENVSSYPSLLLRGDQLQEFEVGLKVAKQRQKHLPLPIQSEFIVPSNSQTVDSLNNFYDGFISYGRADSKPFAIKLHKHLTAQGLKVWLDQNDIPLAVDFQEEIYDGIDKAHNFLFIISPYSVNSEYCLKEIQRAVEDNKRIIPLLHVEEISQETWRQTRNPKKGTDAEWEEYKAKKLHSSYPNMHPAISKINWVYFREDDKDNFEESFKSLVNIIHKHADYVKQHTKFLVQALEWSRNQKQTNYLLIGEELTQAESWLKRKFKDEQPPGVPADLHCEFICESTKNANNLMTKVFISVSENDRAIKDKISKFLMREGLTIWENKTDIKTGTEFQDEINQGIEGADNFVYLMSSDSLASKYCQQEIEHAFANNKRIIPLLIEDTVTTQIPSQLSGLQFINLTRHDDQEKYTGTDKLLKELKEDDAYYDSHKKLLVKALKWQRQDRNPSRLLRGYNLRYFEAWLKVAQQRQNNPPLPIQSEFIATSSRQFPDSSLEVFISYSRANSDFARRLNDALQQLGKTTWFDQESIASGEDFQKEIHRGIESSDNFLFIISPKSVNSPYCADEVEYALSLNKRFVTVLHSNMPSSELHPALARVQWIDFNRHGGDFCVNFSELIRTLDTDRDHVREHTKWSQRALEWQEKGSEDLLLRGSELAIAKNWLQEAEKNNKQPPATELQKAFIGASADLRNRLKQAEANRRRREIRTAWGIAVGSVVAVAVSSGLGLMVWNQSKQAQLNLADSLARYSLSLFNEGKELDAFVAAIRAGKILQKHKASDPEVINSALQSAINKRSEHNRLEGHDSWVISVSFSPDGKTLATGSDDKTIKLWNVETGREIRTLFGHDDSVRSVSFSPDGKTLASGSYDKTIKLWNVETGREIRILFGHDDWVISVSFSPDGKTLATGSDDKTIKL
ncbi:MAG: toll/interleukin-1 receptor domain-containing protein, partial [Xenococcaceae cyanobacterium]